MNEPLVSIVVITYNSSEYIIEGLESVKAQTYKNIELIISDDCSTDNTVELCRNWLEENKQFFKRIELVTTEKNTGVAGNLNRGIREAKGEWIKTLSGDDKFLPYTIIEYVKYINLNPKANLVFAKFKVFGNNTDFVEYERNQYESLYKKIQGNQISQYTNNLKRLFVPGPGLFYKKQIWIQIGGYDERYQFCEEDPFMFKIYNLGYKVDFLNKELYGYNARNNSLGRLDDNKVITRHMLNRIDFYKKTRRKALIKKNMFFTIIKLDLEYDYLFAKQNNARFKLFIYNTISLIMKAIRSFK